MIEAVQFRSVGGRALHLPPNPHVDRERNRNDNHGTDSQYEKPPEHPHNAFRIADVQARTGARKHSWAEWAAASSIFLGHRFAAILDVFRNALQSLARQL